MFCVCRHPFRQRFGAPAVVAKRQARDGGQHTLCSAARGRSHVLGTRQPSPRDGGSDGGRLLLRQWRHLQRHAEQDCNRCGSSSNHTSTLEYAGRARNATSDAVRRNPTLPVHALLQARSARHGRSTSHSPRRTSWAACRPSTRRSRRAACPRTTAATRTATRNHGASPPTGGTTATFRDAQSREVHTDGSPLNSRAAPSAVHAPLLVGLLRASGPRVCAADDEWRTCRIGRIVCRAQCNSALRCCQSTTAVECRLRPGAGTERVQRRWRDERRRLRDPPGVRRRVCRNERLRQLHLRA